MENAYIAVLPAELQNSWAV